MNWSLVKSDDFAQNTFRGVSHDSYLMTHILSDRGGIELCSVSRKSWFSLTYATRYAQAKYILTNLHTILKTHIGIKKCTIKFFFISAISHPPTQWPKIAKIGSKNGARTWFFQFFFDFALAGYCVGGWLIGNEREFYSALFDTYVGFQNGV